MVDLAFSAFAFPTTGAPTNRTLPSRLTDHVDVRDYGAVGNGIADDTIAIQNAIQWNRIPLTTTLRGYSGSFRIASLSWSSAGGGLLSASTTEPHGWPVGVPLGVNLEQNWNGGFGGSAPIINQAADGNRVATPTGTHTFTCPMVQADTPEPFGYCGMVRPQVTNAIWASNVVTLTFSAPHRLDGMTSVQPCNVAGFVPSGINGTRVITGTPTPTTLTFAVTGSGTVTTYGTCKPQPILTFASVPASVVNTAQQALSGSNPPLDAPHFHHTVYTKTATTVTYSISAAMPFQADIPAGTEVNMVPAHRGTIFFPAGVYRTTRPILLTDIGFTAVMRGVPGKSIIRGDFPGYLFDQDNKSAGGGITLFDKLTFINQNPAGKGVRLCQVTTQVRDCVFEANEGLNSSGKDYVAAVCFSLVVAGCRFRPGAHTSGSVGMQAATNNASILGNNFSGFAEGMRLQSFGKTMLGNVFEDNVIGVNSGATPIGTLRANSIQVSAGNTFINNGTGYLQQAGSGTCRIEGNYIEGGPDAAIGFSMISGSNGNVFRGLDIGGAFTTAGWSGASAAAHKSRNSIRAVRAQNSGAGVAWLPETRNSVASVIECNRSQVFTFAQIKGRKIASAVWSSASGGKVTVTTASAHNFSGGFSVVVQGVAIGGDKNSKYNGASVTATAASTGTNTLTYILDDDPGAAADANTGTVVTVGFGASNNRPMRSISWASDVATFRTWGTHDISGHATARVHNVTMGGSTSKAISGAVNNGSGFVRLTVPNVTGWSTGNWLTITGVNGTIEANGTWEIAVIDATHIDLVAVPFVNPYTNGGSIAVRYNKNAWTPAEITILSDDQFSVPMVGNPGTPDAACIPASANLGRDALAGVIVSGTITTTGDTLIGAVCNITDGAKDGGGTALIGDLVQGSGTQHIKVVWTDKGWARCG